ncbi:hypothetical protein SAMN05428959_10827 [Duganella sp. CF517]|uniref:hypothetical protein n=1 Tax=Duganella sp. CF517 TaxID=1881038 RepID=UPI0008B276C9|nr:hypothetical protein [Duganella sp. CF517]SEO44010.1 hypothetical protein SAMN05428959_10827 [Duganella sp. CF517]
MLSYTYQAEKLADARRYLMLPHTEGEEASISECFHACSLAFNKFDESTLNDDARIWVAKLKKLMDTKDVPAATDGKGLWHAKALGFTTDDKIELSTLIDELAFWFSYNDR